MAQFLKKIPVRIYPFFWLMAFLIGWLNSQAIGGDIVSQLVSTLIWVAIIFVSVIFHELGHALTARSFGQQASIALVGFGGVTSRSGGKLKFWQEFLIVLAGPVFGFLLAIAAFQIRLLITPSKMTLLVYALDITFIVNIFWTVLNLLPVQPLDGGKLLGIILEALFGLKGLKIALFLSLLLASSLTVFFFAGQQFFAGIIFFLLAVESYRSWKSSLPVTESDRDNDLQKVLQDAELDLKQGNLEDSQQKFQHIRESTREGVLFVAATQYLAFIMNKLGKLDDAYQLLSPIRSKISDEALKLLQQLAYQKKLWNEAIKVGNDLFLERQDYETAFTNALCYAALNDARSCTGWLQSAIDLGMPNPKIMLEKQEFDSVRDNLSFTKLIQKCS